MKILLYPLLFLLPLTKASEPGIWLREFMRDAVEQKLNNTALANKYFCPNLISRRDAQGEKARKSLDYVLTLQRPDLRKKHIRINKVVFTPYDELPVRQIPPKPFHMLSETKNVYVAQYRGKIILYFLLQDDRIASTLLIGQGDEHNFIDFCH